MNFVTGVFAFNQQSIQTQRSSRSRGRPRRASCWRPLPAAATPGLLDGYGFNQDSNFNNLSAAVFGQVEWSLTDRLRVLPGLRFNYDQKDVDFDQQVYGGLQTTDPALIALQRSILAPQAYTADVDDTNLSGQFTAAYKRGAGVNTYATYATGFKSVGLNLNGVPTDALGRPVLSAATVKPEDVRPRRGRREDRAVPRRDGEPHGLQHRHQGFPGAGRQRRASACCAAIWRTPRKCGCAASSSTARRRVGRPLSLYGGWLHGRTYVSFRTRRRRSRTPAVRR